MSFSIIEMRKHQKVNIININNSQGPEDVVELQKTQKQWRCYIIAQKQSPERKLEKEGFFDDGRAHGETG